MTQSSISEADLHAYLDGQLGPARRAEVDAYLALRPAEALRLQHYEALQRQLHARYDGVLDEAFPPAWTAPAPDSLRATPSKSRGAPARRWLAPLQRIAAGLLVALAGGAAGWYLRGPDSLPSGPAPYEQAAADLSPERASLPRDAAIAHAVYSPERRHPVEVGADQEAHLVAWLSKRLGTSLHPPQLAGQGYALMGGRLLPGAAGPVAQFMYEDGAGQRLTLYVSRQAGRKETAFRFAQEGQVQVFYWIDGSLGYALSGAGIGKAALGDIAATVYRQLEPLR